jgi:hypothetical protein
MENKEKYLNKITTFTEDLGNAKSNQEQEIIITKF